MTRPAGRRLDVVDHLFTQAIVLPAANRQAFVARQAVDPSVAEAVLRMLEDYDRLSGFLDRPALATAVPEIEPGMLLASRFRVVEYLAGGGMGSVYVAEDLKLSGPGGQADEELVALKLCRPELSSLQWLIDQFRQEIRLGRRISHPRICRIHDVHEHVFSDGRPVTFFSMELLRGVSLADAMRPSRPRDLPDVLPVLRAIAEGLDAAHEAGIVHRDLKPGNVMMTASGPVITDFGLALAEVPGGAAQPFSGEGVIGSVPYMAPEQFRGQQVTSAADIFAFGVIGYELTTGALPFPTHPMAAALEARLNETQERLPRWASALEACLHADPGQRPNSAGEVVRRIEAASQRWSRRRVLPWLVGTGALSTLGVGLFRLNVSPVVPNGVLALVLRATGEEEEAESNAIGTMLRAQLGQSAHFEVVSDDQIREALARMQRTGVRPETDRVVARQVALREGAVLLIAPSIAEGNQPSVRMEIEKLGSHPYLPLASWSEEFPYESTDGLITALTEAAGWIRRLTGEHAADLTSRARRPEEVTTGNWEALLAYTKAESARSAGDDQNAIRLLSRALELDPQFAAANMRLGDILMGHGQWDRAWTLQSNAAGLVSQRGLTDRESLRILGLFLHDSGDNRKAEKVFEQWAAEFPGDYLPLFYAAACQDRLGRPTEALDTLELALKRAPGNPHIVLMRAQIHMQQGRLKQARSDVDSVRGVNSWWWRYEAELHFLNLDLGSALAAFDKFGEYGTEETSVRFLLRAFLFTECGDPGRAIQELRDGLAFDAARERLQRWMPPKWIALGSLALQQGDAGMALDAANRAAEQRDDLRSLLLAAMLLFRCNAVAQAERLRASLVDIPSSPKFQELDLKVAGYRAITRRRYLEAVELFQHAAGLAWTSAPADGLAEALDLSGNEAAAEPLWLGIARYPGRYWLEPEKYWPGTYRRSLERMAPKDSVAQNQLRALDAAKPDLSAVETAKSSLNRDYARSASHRGDRLEADYRGFFRSRIRSSFARDVA